MEKYDLIVIGSGPAGQRAAIQAAKFGKRVALVEKLEVVGGTAITGGRGSVVGLVLGCLLLVSLGPACIFLGLSPSWQLTVPLSQVLPPSADEKSASLARSMPVL